MVFQTDNMNKQFEKVLMNDIHLILVRHKEMLDYFNVISKIEFGHTLTPISEPTPALVVNPSPTLDPNNPTPAPTLSLCNDINCDSSLIMVVSN